MLDQLSFDDFKDYRGKTFNLMGPGGTVEITLLDVRKSTHPKSSLVRRHAFAILFVAPATHPLGSQMYNIIHPTRGVMEGMFINPVVPPAQDFEKTKDVRFYEAIFN